MSSKFTCITCRVAFFDSEVQRQHYKTDWHRYNLKRKVADLPPVPAEDFKLRVLLQREQDEANEKNDSVYCKVCHKSFNSSKSFENHLKSKKHLALGKKSHEDKDVEQLQQDSTQSDNSHTVKTEFVPCRIASKSSSSEDDSDIEEVDSDEWNEEFSDNNPILRNDCLFCKHHSAAMMKNLKHMTLAHSFFVPDIEYVTDMKRLLCYLGEKIIQGYMCLWCNDRGKAFHSAEAAQQHMIDKGHCKMLHEGEALLEYSDYYDYSSSYPDNFVNNSSGLDDEVEIPVIEDEDSQLVLPSGTVIGHRSLLRYYRQNPNRIILACRKSIKPVLIQYKALGWTETDKNAVARKARDLRFMRQVQSKYNMKLGIKANSLSIKRPQVNY
ncbi:zinc finger protein 622 [Homalodisca vitripennis]|uniref:zinc finger protein 622 n=1 Tax=Homalodisca vitripennis TaxID=197043 RepID=UPI001EECDC80|nr:zinc finger protein 622 [Homalodisca vitripennis]